MSEWFYKATNAKLDHFGTLLLASRGFLCRSAYTGAVAHNAIVRSCSPSAPPNASSKLPELPDAAAKTPGAPPQGPCRPKDAPGDCGF